MRVMRGVIMLLTALVMLGIGCGPAPKYQPGIDTVAHFGDGTFQIARGYNFYHGADGTRTAVKVYELYRVPSSERLISDVKRWRQHRDRVYLYGDARYFVLTPDTGELETYRELAAAPEEYRRHLRRVAPR